MTDSGCPSRQLLLVVTGLVCALLSTGGATEDGYKSYSGYALVSATPQGETHLEALKSLVKRSLPGVDVWKGPSVVKRSVDMLVSPEAMGDVTLSLRAAGLQYSVLENHVENHLAKHRRVRRAVDESSFSPANFSLTEYHTYEEISEWLDYLDSTCGSACEVINIGKTYEGRDMKVIKFANGRKPTLWIDGGIHAREWVAPAAALYIIHKLLDPKCDTGRYLRSHFNVYVLPVINADGYSYTWTHNRMWRKTRSRNVDPKVTCRGADPNRNFGYKWGGQGASTNPCDESYRGSKAYSEVEARNMRDYMSNITSEPSVYLSLHAYGQYFLTSWGYGTEVPSDFTELMSVAKHATQTMKKVNGEKYEYGSAARLLYAAAGGSDDWAKGSAGYKWAYTIELRDKGKYGFVLPASLIQPTCTELWAGIRSVAGDAVKARRRRVHKKRH